VSKKQLIVWSLLAFVAFFLPAIVAFLSAQFDRSRFAHDSMYVPMVHAAIIASLLVAPIVPAILVFPIKMSRQKRILCVVLLFVGAVVEIFIVVAWVLFY
jgi:hypothetical protein